MTKGYQTFTDAATATGLTDRELVFVAGETDIGDTGQGHFIYRPAGTGAASIDIIVVTAGGRMFRATMPSSEVADQIAAAIQGTDTPVAVSSLPATAATAANQALIKTAVDAVASAIAAAGVNATAAAIASAMQGGTQPVSASALPLPTGAATSAKQDTLAAAVDAVTAAVSAQGANVTAAQIDTVLRATPIAVTGGQTVQETANAFGTAPASVAPGSVAGLLAGPVPITLPASTGAILSLTTSATGATYVPFASAVCQTLDLINDSGTDLEYRRGGAGATVKVQSGTGREIYGITNANQIDVRRVDQSNTQVTVKAEAMS